MARGLYHYLAEAWAGGARDSWIWDVVMKQRLIEWRREPSIVRVEKPTRINKARQYGYKAKQGGIIVVRVRLRRGGPFNRRRPNSGRRPKRMGVYGITTSKSLQLIAEERAARKHPNMEVLGSYWVGEDGTYVWYEVILVDPSHPAIRSDPDFAWLVGKEDREGRRRRRLRERQRRLIERLRKRLSSLNLSSRESLLFMAISQLDLEVNIHATEDLDKAITHLMKLLTDKAPIVIEVLYGHYGNPIYRIQSTIKDKDLAMSIIKSICSSLVNKDYLLRTLESRVDDSGNVFLRLDKQEFVMSRIVLSDGGDDVIRVRVRVTGVDAVQFINEVCK